MIQEESNEIRQILQGVLNGEQRAKESLKYTYFPILRYIAGKYCVDLTIYEEDIFRFIEESVSEYLSAEKDCCISFAVWYIYRLKEYFALNNIEIPDFAEETAGNTELLSSIRPYMLDKGSPREEINAFLKNLSISEPHRFKIQSSKKSKIILLIALVVFMVCFILLVILNGNTWESLYADDGGIEYEVTYNKVLYMPGDDIKITASLKNVSDRNIVLEAIVVKTPEVEILSGKPQDLVLIRVDDSYEIQISAKAKRGLEEIVIVFAYSDFISEFPIPIHVIGNIRV